MEPTVTEGRRYHKVLGYVWCEYHAGVHENDHDPFDEGMNCRWGHQSLYRLTREADRD